MTPSHDIAPLEHITDRELVTLAHEVICEMVYMLADLEAPPANASLSAKVDRFYSEAFGIGNPKVQDDIALTVLEEMDGTLQ